ncbi:MAG: hypothetical protein IH586_07160 [Anaerolineaceae bacterium]|nr:hypothetical protein [Anaerolineaceae bacterium]
MAAPKKITQAFFYAPVIVDENLAGQAKQINIILWIDIAVSLAVYFFVSSTRYFQPTPVLLGTIIFNTIISLIMQWRLHMGRVSDVGYF